MNAPALFVRHGDSYLADPICDGPWAEGALHGGAPAALLTHLLGAELDRSGLALARLTCEFVRPTPRGPLRPSIEVVRPGRRVTLLDASLSGPDGREVTRARALFLAPSEVDAPGVDGDARVGGDGGVDGSGDGVPFAGPEDGSATDWVTERPMFATHALDIAFVEGRFREPGPATAWFRLRGDIVEGEPTGATERVAAAADFGNGIASVLDWSQHTFINPDLTIHLERAPIDEWVAVRARMRTRAGSVASAESVLYDRHGRIGTATQSLLIGRAG